MLTGGIMGAQEIIDLKTFNDLRAQLGSDFVTELIDIYSLDTEELIEKLRQALVAKDAVSFGRFAHTIKSSSASLGALVFSQQARELEMIGKSSDLSNAGSKLELLAAGFHQVKRSLEELRNEP
jgi:HPt (histidine-containing phosphotransfer) domain-containing protein